MSKNFSIKCPKTFAAAKVLLFFDIRKPARNFPYKFSPFISSE